MLNVPEILDTWTGRDGLTYRVRILDNEFQNVEAWAPGGDVQAEPLASEVAARLVHWLQTWDRRGGVTVGTITGAL